MPNYSPETVLFVWGTSILLFLVVAVVVALMLWLIRNTAAQIRDGAGAIWTQGKMVANNTIQIPLFLSQTGRATGAIRQRVLGIGAAAQAIASHAKGCPGCPQCVIGKESA